MKPLVTVGFYPINFNRVNYLQMKWYYVWYLLQNNVGTDEMGGR